MDTNKLLQILTLVEADESEFGIKTKIDDIKNLVAQNTPDAGVQAGEKTDSLIQILQSTRAAQFTLTEVEILSEIGAEFYFGEGLIDTLKDVLLTRSFEVIGRLESLHSERQTMFTKLVLLKNTLIELNVEPYKQPLPEIGLTLPDGLLSIDDVSKKLREFSNFLKAVSEPLHEGVSGAEEIKITRMNKGSGEFFFGVTPELAKTVLNILSDLATVIAVAYQIKNSNSVKNNKYVSVEDVTQLDEMVKKIADSTVEKFLDEIPKKIGKKTSESQATAIKNHAKLLIKWIPLGVHFEVVYDKEVTPVAVTEDVKEKEKEILIQKQLGGVKEMYKLPLDEVVLLPEVNNDETEPDEKI